MTQNDTDRSCPACGGSNHETVEIERESYGEDVYEILACNDCYAGFRITYEAVEKEITHEPQRPTDTGTDQNGGAE